MGFDNECIVNMQSLPGEYFCPVCRLLVYPNEALQTQCTHLYCKPCLIYIVGSTRACPYDGYLVTEADTKVVFLFCSWWWWFCMVSFRFSFISVIYSPWWKLISRLPMPLVKFQCTVCTIGVDARGKVH